MKWWLNFDRFSFVMDEAGGEGGGGGGAPKTDDSKNDIQSLKEQNASLLKRLEALEGKNKGGAADDDDGEDLAAKAKKDREKHDSDAKHQKKLESALKFNLESANWVKENASLLPKTIQGIFDQAAKENYDSAIEKDSAIKVGIISEFFAQQANVDLLTTSQKVAIEDFSKLTKNVKQDRAQEIYDTIFEPTFEMLKRIKKAEQQRKGLADPSNAENAYKEKLVGLARKKYLGEK